MWTPAVLGPKEGQQSPHLPWKAALGSEATLSPEMTMNNSTCSWRRLRTESPSEKVSKGAAGGASKCTGAQTTSSVAPWTELQGRDRIHWSHTRLLRLVGRKYEVGLVCTAWS